MTLDPAKPEETGSDRSPATKCGASCLGLLALGALSIAIATAMASASLDDRVAWAEREIAAFRQEDQRRATLLGQPDNDESTLADYNGALWVLYGGNPSQLPQSWRLLPPELPDDIDEVLALVAPEGAPFDRFLAEELLRGIDPTRAGVGLSPSEQAKYEQAQQLFRRLQPVLRYVRRGLRRGKVDWGTRWEQGLRLFEPDRMQTAAIASFMAYEASLQEPSLASQTGLEIVAFGQDLARQGSFPATLGALRVCYIGFQSLAHTLSRPGLERLDCERLIEVLAKFRPALPPRTPLERQRLLSVVTALEESGRRLDAGEGKLDEVPEEKRSGIYWATQVDLFHARELAAYEAWVARAILISELPPGQWRGPNADLREDIQAAYYLTDTRYEFWKELVPVLSLVGAEGLVENMARTTAVLAAAHLYRLGVGFFPDKISDLRGLLGTRIFDLGARAPGTPLCYGLQGELLRCWTRGQNGIDEGGPPVVLHEPWPRTKRKPRNAARKTDDRGLQTRAPAQE